MTHLNSDLGLSEGDHIDSYISRAAGDGEITCDPGTYTTDLTGLGDLEPGDTLDLGGSDVTTLESDGSGTNVRFRHSSGNITIKGFSVEGVHGKDSKFAFYPQLDEGAELLWEDVHLVASIDQRGRWFYGGGSGDMRGRMTMRGCVIAHSPNNLIYMDKSSHAPGGITLENCVLKNSHVGYFRIGGGEDYVRNCLFIVDDNAPAGPASSGSLNADFIRVRNVSGEDGSPGNFLVENSEFIYKSPGSGNPINFYDDARETEGTVRDCRFEIDSSADERVIKIYGSGGENKTVDNLHVTGSGNLRWDSPENEGDIYKGSDAEEPYFTEEAVLSGEIGDGDFDGASDGNSEPTFPEDETDTLELLSRETDIEYRAVINGDARGTETESAKVASGDELWSEAGFTILQGSSYEDSYWDGDAYDISGEVVYLEIEGDYEVRWNGETISIDELTGRSGRKYGDGKYGEGEYGGSEESYDDGYDEGLNDGYDEGHEDGYAEGYEDGFDDGFDEGHSEGHEDGLDEGIEAGYEEGYSDGVEESDGETVFEGVTSEEIKEIIRDLEIQITLKE